MRRPQGSPGDLSALEVRAGTQLPFTPAAHPWGSSADSSSGTPRAIKMRRIAAGPGPGEALHFHVAALPDPVPGGCRVRTPPPGKGTTWCGSRP